MPLGSNAIIHNAPVWSPKLSRPREIALYLLIFLFIAATFVLLPIQPGDDWTIFMRASQRVAAGTPLYGAPSIDLYYYPPWMAAILAPIGLLPLKWSYALLLAASLIAAVFLVRRYAAGRMKLVLFVLSPAMFYTLIHGQIDVLILAGVLLPAQWWPLLGVTKPQVALGLLFGVPRPKWRQAAVIALGALAVSLLLFPDWPLVIFRDPPPFRWHTHNLWLGLWPFQVPVGIGLLLLGIQRNDERFLLSASPFLLPYAALSSLSGPWLATLSSLKDWQAGVIWLSWWGAVVYRGLGGV